MGRGTPSACIFIVTMLTAGRDLRLLSVDAFSVMCQLLYYLGNNIVFGTSAYMITA